MTLPQGIISFLPWLRQGLGTQTVAATGPRPVLHVSLDLVGDTPGMDPVRVPHDIQLYGPGDIIGIDPRMISRTEPWAGTTNFEPNFLAHIEFYEEDFPWRYTPLSTDGQQLPPWIALIVLKEDEFHDQPPAGGVLPSIQLTKPEMLPPWADLWAWAHVHINSDLTPGDPFYSDAGSVIAKAIEGPLTANRDLACARLLCPRRLEPSTAYHAFLVPAFETGRLAGLGKDPGGVTSAAAPAWKSPPDPDQAELPVYSRWEFRTSVAGDFEALARLLKPRAPQPGMGVRPMDVSNPGPPLKGYPGLVLQLGGALRVPRPANAPAATDPDNWDTNYPGSLAQDIAGTINLADDHVFPGSDPLVTLPLYGCWHALVQRLLRDRQNKPVARNDNWVHKLNLDPRYRVPAGFGTRVVSDTREDLMKAAWDQIGAVLEANRRIRLAQLAREVAQVWYSKHLQPLRAASADRAFALTGPVHRRVVTGGSTVYSQEAQGTLSSAATSAAFRRAVRPRGRLVKALGAGDGLLTRLGKGKVCVAPPKHAPGGVLTVDKLAGMDSRFGVTSYDSQTDRLKEHLPRRTFTVQVPGLTASDLHAAEQDNADGTLFKDGVGDVSTIFVGSRFHDDDVPAIDVGGLADAVLQAIDPTRTIPGRVLGLIDIPSRIRGDLDERFQEAMAYPRFDKPMYEALKAISNDLLLPNLQLIQPNSITLLESNPKFIEAYLVGLNHAFARELLWREYPTDQRGSYFRQFWNPESQLPTPPPPGKDPRDLLYDVPALHTWPRDSQLGSHNQRSSTPDGSQAILVIRGELLKRYPNAVIFAQKAKWQTPDGTHIDKTLPRDLDDPPDADANDPVKVLAYIRTPIYEAKVEPDIYFFGFDLAVKDARGDPSTDNAPGWFFVLKERPGEPRFGLEDPGITPPATVNDLGWEKVAFGTPPAACLPANGIGAFGLTDPAHLVPPNLDPDVTQQYAEDHTVDAALASSARWAYLLFRPPVLVAIHAADLLLKPTS